MQDGICLQELEYSSGMTYASRMNPEILRRNVVRLRKRLGKTQVQFAEAFGVNQSTVSKWETKGVDISAESLSLMAEMAEVSGVEFGSSEWVPGERAPTKGRHEKGCQTLEEIAADQGWVLVEELNLELGMGATFLEGGDPEVIGVVPFPEAWLRGLHRGSHRGLKVVRGSGDSMQPTIHDGDVILIDTTHRQLDEQDVLWAVTYGNLGMIRRLKQKPNGHIMLNPDNSVVRADEAVDGEMTILGRVIWIARRM